MKFPCAGGAAVDAVDADPVRRRPAVNQNAVLGIANPHGEGAIGADVVAGCHVVVRIGAADMNAVPLVGGDDVGFLRTAVAADQVQLRSVLDQHSLLLIAERSSHCRRPDVVALELVGSRLRAVDEDPVAAVLADHVASPRVAAADGVVMRPADDRYAVSGVADVRAVARVGPNEVALNVIPLNGIRVL